MKLFYAPPSPFARKVRIAARELDLMGATEEIAVNPYQDDPRLIAANPAGLVPAMIAPDGTPLMDSPLIVQYLNDQADKSLIPADGAERWAVLNEAAMADAIMDFAVAATYEKRRNDVPPSSAFLTRKLAKIQSSLERLPRKSGIVETVHLGDIATACALSYLDFRHPDLDWRSIRPDLGDWHAAIETRPAFEATKPLDHLP